MVVVVVVVVRMIWNLGVLVFRIKLGLNILMRGVRRGLVFGFEFEK
jgi:hypothetical protein